MAATTDFLNSLSAEQRARMLFVFTAQKTATAARFARAHQETQVKYWQY